jgi:hypothetical protein
LADSARFTFEIQLAALASFFFMLEHLVFHFNQSLLRVPL